ncbi:MAG: LemA family protein [Planctomycetota bacterium]
MKKILLPLLVVFALLVVLAIALFGWYIYGYNTVVAKDQAVKGAWGDIDAQLKRRYDLIPNLVATVKGYAAHEAKIFTEIAEAREAYFGAGSRAAQMETASRLEGLLSRLIALQENYPDLKANESFLSLQDQLEGTENRIAVARTRYNAAVRDLNTFVRSFFGGFFAGRAGVTEAEYFEAPAEQTETVPTVDFTEG